MQIDARSNKTSGNVGLIMLGRGTGCHFSRACVYHVKNQHAGIWNVDGQHSTRRSIHGRGTVTRKSSSHPGFHRFSHGSSRVSRQLVAGDAATRLLVVRRCRSATATGRDWRPTPGDQRTRHRHGAVRRRRSLDARRALGPARRDHGRRQQQSDRLLPAARSSQVRYL